MPTKLSRNGTITQSRLRELVSYDPLTGHLTYLRDIGGRRAGERCGWLHKRGWRYLSVDGGTYRAARLIWFYMTGEWPEVLVDHENRVRDDDRWVNLRLANNAQNGRNATLSKRNTSGTKGVGWHGRLGKWYASIRVDRRLIHLGYFHDIDSAAAARRAAELKYFGDFAPALAST